MDDATKEKVATYVVGSKSLSFEEKSQFFQDNLSLGTFASLNVYEKLVLVSLVSLMYIKLKEKNPRITPLEIIDKLTADEEKSTAYIEMLESLAILVEEFSFGCKTANSFGLKDSKEIVMKIKEILSTWVPF